MTLTAEGSVQNKIIQRKLPPKSELQKSFGETNTILVHHNSVFQVSQALVTADVPDIFIFLCHVCHNKMIDSEIMMVLLVQVCSMIVINITVADIMS